jgi:hypothetical protein
MTNTFADEAEAMIATLVENGIPGKYHLHGSRRSGRTGSRAQPDKAGRQHHRLRH